MASHACEAAVYGPAVSRDGRNMRPHVARSTHIVAPSSMTDRGLARFGLHLAPGPSRGIGWV
jgi:hypothetical protein